MSRIKAVDVKQAGGYIGKVLEGQAKTWGAPLSNHLLYARRPKLFKAVRGMWASLNDGALIDEGLVCLINRRVAAHNGCLF